jgi:hypothetical protein
MPIRYTYKQVHDIFTQNKCTLISENYKNQLFDYNNVDKERLLNLLK